MSEHYTRVARCTDMQKNVDDPYGDGDQSLIRDRDAAQGLRDVWSVGADFQPAQLSAFHKGCFVGDLRFVKSQVAKHPPGSTGRTELLECRVSLMRFPPLIACISGALLYPLPRRDRKRSCCFLETEETPPCIQNSRSAEKFRGLDLCRKVFLGCVVPKG